MTIIAKSVRGDPAQEKAWLGAIAQGDRRAFEALYKEFAPRVFRFVVRMIRDESKAEEVVNDVMVEIWKNAGLFEGRSSASTWILSIARFRALNAVRGKKLDTTDIDEATNIADEQEGLAEITDRHARSKLLKTAIEHLSQAHREVLELTFFHGLNCKEIAEIVQRPENTVKTRMFHAKKRLAPILEGMGLAGAA